jgi:Na+-driven multidrug efflux pump
MASPLLSMMDVAGIGARGAFELAALGPATRVADMLTAQLAFLGAATTNEIALARARGDNEAMRCTSLVASVIAITLGVVIGTVVAVSAPWLLRAICGDNEELARAGVIYVRVRALALPFSLLRKVNASTLLGLRDSLTPMCALLAGALANLAGNRLLIPTFGLLGAALSTAASEVVSSLWLIAVLLRRGRFASLSTLPPLADSKAWYLALLPFLLYGPMIFTSAMKEVLNTSTAATAARMGGARAAAFTISFAIARFGSHLGFAGNSLARAYLPQYIIVYDPGSPQPVVTVTKRPWLWIPPPPLGFDHEAARPALRAIFIVCAGLSALTVTITVASLTWGGHFFTTDAAVIEALKSSVPSIALLLAVQSTSLTLEGILLSRRDLGFIAASYAIFAVISQGAYFAIQRRDSVFPVTLAAVWSVNALFQVGRCALFATRTELFSQPPKHIMLHK